jgi:hypothetical protein
MGLDGSQTVNVDILACARSIERGFGTKYSRDGKESRWGFVKLINDRSKRQNSERDGAMTVTEDNDGAGRFTNGQRGQAGVRAFDRARARHKILSRR